MTGTDLCVNKPHTSRSYLNHLILLGCIVCSMMWVMSQLVVRCLLLNIEACIQFSNCPCGFFDKQNVNGISTVVLSATLHFLYSQ